MSSSVNVTSSQQEGDALHIFLTNCLKTQNEKVVAVEQKLVEEDVSYDDMIGFSEKDLRDILSALNIKLLFIARIIKYLKTKQMESTVFRDNKNTKFVKIYISAQETKAFDKLSKAYKVTSDGSNNIQTAIKNIELNRQNTLKCIETTFNVLHKDLEKRKRELTKQTNEIAKRKQTVLKQQLHKVTKYRNELQSAKNEYQSTLQNQSLKDSQRSEKNVTDIDKAINSKFKYDMTDPLLSDHILFEYKDEHRTVLNHLTTFGSIIGAIKPPKISVVEIKSNECKVTIKACQENIAGIKLERYEIKYSLVEDDEKKIDVNWKDGFESKVVELDGNDGDHKVVVKGLRPTSKYNFCARACYQQIGFTQYSNVIRVNTTLQKQRLLCWDRKHHGNGITFVSNQRIKYSQQWTAACIADYVVKKQNHDVFEWSVRVHKYSNHSWIGFVDAKEIDQMNYNSHVAYGGTYFSFGAYINGTSLPVYNGTQSTLSYVTTTALKENDIFKFVADVNRKEVALHHNNKSLGVLWKYLCDAIVPVASNSTIAAEYTITATVPNDKINSKNPFLFFLH